MMDFPKSTSLQQLELAEFSPIMAPLAPQQPQSSDFPFDFSKLHYRIVEVGLYILDPDAHRMKHTGQ
jgi:hypothetical protein